MPVSGTMLADALQTTCIHLMTAVGLVFFWGGEGMDGEGSTPGSTFVGRLPVGLGE